MKNIKFRAWNKRSKVMIDWELIHDNWAVMDINEFRLKIGEVMQFTGLKDMNGTDIYEEDILEQINRDNSVSQYIVEYNPPQFSLRRISDGGILGSLCLSEQFHLFKVIGNKYENL